VGLVSIGLPSSVAAKIAAAAIPIVFLSQGTALAAPTEPKRDATKGAAMRCVCAIKQP
jgi:hypothetical protein